MDGAAAGRRSALTGLHGFVAALAVAAVTSPAAALSPPFVPIPFELNQTSPCNQRDPQVVRLADGDLMALWIGDVGEELGIAARRLRPDGVPLGDELALLIPQAPSAIRHAELAALPDGGFLVAWTWQENFSPALSHFVLSRFDAAGELVATFDSGIASDAVHSGFALAVDDHGRSAAVWTDRATVWLTLFDVDLVPLTGTRAVGQPTEAGGRIFGVDVARTGRGQTLVIWEESPPTTDPRPPFDRIRGRVLAADGAFLGSPFQVNQVTAETNLAGTLSPAIAAKSEESFVVAWATDPTVGVLGGVYAQELNELGAPIGESFQVNSDSLLLAADVEVVPTLDRGYAVLWSAYPPQPPFDPLPPGQDLDPIVRVRRFGSGGIPAGDDVELWNPNDGRFQTSPAAVFSQGSLTQVWRDAYPFPPILPPACPEDPRILAMPTRLACVPTEARLCLQDGRFSLQVVRSVEHPSAGTIDVPATAELLTDDTGTFWFFRPGNVELMTKVLDGRRINGRFWFFSGALSNVDYTIRVTDTETGTQRDYPSGEALVSFADTATFFDPPPPPFSIRTDARAARKAPPEPFAAPTHPVSACEDPEILCLHGGSFRTRIDWTDPRTGNSGVGFAENLTDESGYFWFFRDSNAEVVFKLLDGRPVNGYFWTFVGGLTDVEYTLTVDSSLFPPSTWSYQKPAGLLESVADTRALFDCPICSTSGGQAAAERHDPVRPGNGLP